MICKLYQHVHFRNKHVFKKYEADKQILTCPPLCQELEQSVSNTEAGAAVSQESL